MESITVPIQSMGYRLCNLKQSNKIYLENTHLVLSLTYGRERTNT